MLPGGARDRGPCGRTPLERAACHVAVFRLNSELSVGDEEELVGVGVPVPGELALNYHDPNAGTEHQCRGLTSPPRTGSFIPEPLSFPAPVGSVAGNGRCGMTGTGRTEPAVAAAGDLPRRPGETVLITGASSGIGRELARLFAGDGAELVLVARSESRLRELADELAAGYGARAQVVPVDLSHPAGSGEIMEALAQQHIEVDVLVNNAGFGAHGPVAGIGVARQLDMIEVNVAALTRLTALLLPGMLERRRGAILNVASTAAFTPGPNQAVYCATKAYVLSFTEALAEEVRGSGVRVSCLAPGATGTGFAAQAGMGSSRLFRWGVMDAGRVARAGHDGLRRGRTLVIPGLLNQALAFSVRLSPRILATKVSGYLQA